MLKRLSVFCLGITLLFTAHLSQVQAQISGFNFLQGYTLNQGDNDPAPTVGQDFIDITNDGGNFRSVFFNTRQSIDTFTASFSYEASAGPVGSSLQASRSLFKMTHVEQVRLPMCLRVLVLAVLIKVLA